MRVWIALCVALSLLGAGRAHAQGRPDPLRAKLDPTLRRLAAAGDDSVLSVFIRTTGPVGERERARLRRAGAQVGTVAGTILTARLSARNLRRVAALPFVRSIQSSRVLRPQGEARPRPPARLQGTARPRPPASLASDGVA